MTTKVGQSHSYRFAFFYYIFLILLAFFFFMFYHTTSFTLLFLVVFFIAAKLQVLLKALAYFPLKQATNPHCVV